MNILAKMDAIIIASRIRTYDEIKAAHANDKKMYESPGCVTVMGIFVFIITALCWYKAMTVTKGKFKNLNPLAKGYTIFFSVLSGLYVWLMWYTCTTH